MIDAIYPLPPTKYKIISVVVDSLRRTAARWRPEETFGPNDRGWTKEQFKDLAERIEHAIKGDKDEGSLKNWIGYADSGKPEGDPRHFQLAGEWLYDFSWLQYSPDKLHLVHAPLVIESEYHQDPYEVISDLDKLILSRGIVRGLFFETGGERTLDAAIGQIRQSHLTDNSDTYVFGFWRTDKKRYEIRVFEPSMTKSEVISAFDEPHY